MFIGEWREVLPIIRADVVHGGGTKSGGSVNTDLAFLLLSLQNRKVKRMGSEANLRRLLCCGIWTEHVAANEHYRGCQMFDSKGKLVDCFQNDGGGFFHLRVWFHQDTPAELINIMAVLLKTVADGKGESFTVKVHEDYGNWEIVLG